MDFETGEVGKQPFHRTDGPNRLGPIQGYPVSVLGICIFITLLNKWLEMCM